MKMSFAKKASLGLALVLSTAGLVQAETLKLSHVRPQGTAIDNDVKWFAEHVQSATDDKLKVKIYAANALGDYTVVQERVGLGAIDMAVQPPASDVDRRFQILYMPYMVKNWAEAQRVFGPGTPMRSTVAELYQAQGIKVLAAWPVYFGGIALNKDVPAAGNPDVAKGVKLRVPPIKTFQLLADQVGYIASPLPFSETFTAVQTGVVDGVMGSGAEGYYSSFSDVTKFYVPSNTHFEVWYLLLNQERYDDLEPEQQAALDKVALEFESRRWKTAQVDQAAHEQLLAKAGTTIVAVSDADIEVTAQKVRANVWPEIINDIGKEWADNVLKSALKD
ncbi:TRAP transporter substrate-binding protein DctP [Pseudomonas sp.]|uniref:TRAP transporter substrate-binding protein DctP n=1 Tax=Pseudomonas sp. TaxID=306 RepID=UPI00272FF3BF|nr:TRAP transporter substrate-binding protein DctP [Pseudomonas sp.]MDP2243385.1 TRAP transporter substrate-binding protein DctP [Pseudomonas sp.]